jgi:pseudouridine-5'-phosphate glycosidase
MIIMITMVIVVMITTGEASLSVNIALVKHNAKVGAQVRR